MKKRQEDKEKARARSTRENTNPPYAEVYTTMLPTIRRIVHDAAEGGLGSFAQDQLERTLIRTLELGYLKIDVETYGGYERYLTKRLTLARDKFFERISEHPERHFAVSINIAVETDDGRLECEQGCVAEGMLPARDEVGIIKEPEQYRHMRALQVRELLATLTPRQREILWTVAEEGSQSAASRALGLDPRDNKVARVVRRFAKMVREAELEPEGRPATPGFKPKRRRHR